jgi:hypothetical protein
MPEHPWIASGEYNKPQLSVAINIRKGTIAASEASTVENRSIGGTPTRY